MNLINVLGIQDKQAADGYCELSGYNSGFY